MQKITKFRDIPQFTRAGSYEVYMQLRHLISWIEEEKVQNGLQLNPDFQRGHVWSEDQQIKYIEYFLSGGKSGRTLYFNYPSWQKHSDTEYNDFVCVDGLQRITSIQRFMNNEIKVFGSYFNEFEGIMRDVTTTVIVNINEIQTKAGVLKWYIEMNSGGTIHTDEEIEKVRKLLDLEKGD